MLKALELCGFKSFADKTRFEFPPGITVVVGPNGSGKSNIVDAIKWVLGEQSAKSLRGREMADVIFQGSGGNSASRKAANTAEVTIVFDNEGGLLGVESQEVRVTRRVYRSGEGEYQINGALCRLRDVKDLFRGTGVGTDAYSLIEQGKVDTLLQASPRDRRAIFEEAAGISRFKAKKIETQRRLERVDQNLERLSDIVDEVESQLRSVRNQASKARRYKDYSDRLQTLRTRASRSDWQQLTGELEEFEQRLARFQQAASVEQQAVVDSEQQLAEIDATLVSTSASLQSVEARRSQYREQSTGLQSTQDYQRQRVDELSHEIGRLRRQWQSMNSRAGDLGLQLGQLQQQVADADTTDAAIRQRLATSQQSLDTTESQWQQCQRERDQQRDEHAHQLRISSDLSRRIGRLETEFQSGEAQIGQLQTRLAAIDSELESAAERHQVQAETEADLERQEADLRTKLGQAREGLNDREQQLNRQQQQAVDLQRRLAIATERADVLQDLERRHEGLSPGVRDLLKRAEDMPLGALASIRGMVADLIRVDVRMAPLIDAALGELTQYIVVEGTALVEEIARGELALAGRVGLLDYSVGNAPGRETASWTADRALLGRADEFVEVTEDMLPLVRHLLGQTWCVETLQDALRLRPQPTHPARFVTRRGELLDTDGHVQAGPRQHAIGLVSRRSELRSLQLEIVELEPQTKQTDELIGQLKQQIAQSAQTVTSLTSQYDELASQLMSARLGTRAEADRVASLGQQQADMLQQREAQCALNLAAESQRSDQLDKLDAVSVRISEIEAQLQSHQDRLSQLAIQRQTQLDATTDIKVELAKSEQHLDGLKGQLIRCEEDQRERERAVSETRSQLRQACERRQLAERAILHATSQQAECYLERERIEMQRSAIDADRRKYQQQRQAEQQRWEAARRQKQAADEQCHQAELSANQSRLQRDALAERVRDEYQIELADAVEIAAEDDDQPLGREDVEREISQLRKRIGNIGAVNLAALDEIEALEKRHGSLASQYQDLVDAKDALGRIIHRINADSRRLFTESLETIRANFQVLFRRIFGGGNADIVLEEGVDLLDAGIDIVATPPGKQSLSISLLSGGERALTAVALLLAIFQYRPSPFCVLDEVDGPLDEANIGRFVDVLNEFLKWTKFVIVTHSKKTMTAANTLYGVTMQESGISKRVSVQFEDVSEDGHIRPEALERSATRQNNPPSPDDDDQRGAA